MSIQCVDKQLARVSNVRALIGLGMATHAHIEWLKEGVLRWNKRRRRVDFSPDLSGVNFFELLPPDFRDAPKTSRTFERIDLSNANLRGADLSHLNFHGANFRNADLQNANLSLSNFDEAKFIASDLSNSDASNASFRDALFEHASLAKIDLEGAELSGASFVAVELKNAKRDRLEAEGARFYNSVASYRDRQAIGDRLPQSDTSRLIAKDKAQPQKTPKNRYDVFFGTNRTPIFERGALTGFDGNISDIINYGLCEVIVPDGHRIGSLVFSA